VPADVLHFGQIMVKFSALKKDNIINVSKSPAPTKLVRDKPQIKSSIKYQVFKEQNWVCFAKKSIVKFVENPYF
jgi:hypothetical protein